MPDLYIAIRPPDRSHRLWTWGVGDKKPDVIDLKYPTVWGLKWGYALTRKHAEARAKHKMQKMRQRFQGLQVIEPYMIDENAMLQQQEIERIRRQHGGYHGG